MKKALISIVEPRETGYRVAQVISEEGEFPVASQMFWLQCSDSVTADQFWYDPVDQQIKPLPQQETL